VSIRRQKAVLQFGPSRSLARIRVSTNRRLPDLDVEIESCMRGEFTPDLHSSLTTLTLTQKTLIVDKEVKRLVTHLIDAWRTRAHAETAKAKEQSH
jgi:hypothetical protein